MRKKKAAGYLAVIASLIALSIVTPLVITTVSDHITGWIRSSEEETEINETERMSEDGMAALIVETESEADDDISSFPDDMPSGKESAGKAGRSDQTIIIDSPAYEEPVYDSAGAEDAANQKAYQDMTERLLSLSEAARTYKDHFHPSYDELLPGLMNEFIAGLEDQFYEELSSYCFGHYNTSYQIKRVRFDALLEDTEERKTVILEFFTEGDLKNESYVPDLKLCTYNNLTQAFVFFSGAGR